MRWRGLAGLREICYEFGIILIFDEVMTGFGRTGAAFGLSQGGQCERHGGEKAPPHGFKPCNGTGVLTAPPVKARSKPPGK